MDALSFDIRLKFNNFFLPREENLIQHFILIGTALVCYECHDDECGEHEYGHGVTCQMENPEDEHYGDFCYVAHTGMTKLLNLYTIS